MGFYVLELGVPGKPACPDEFEELGPAVLLCPESKILTVQVSVNAVYIQMGVMPNKADRSLGDIVWQRARSWLPTSFSVPREFDAVRVRNFVAGKEAQVTLEAY
jgi:hypothetical protein